MKLVHTHNLQETKMSSFLQLLKEQEHDLLFFTIIIPIIFVFLLLKWFFPLSSNENSPPSPPKLPIIGNLHQLGLHPHRSLHVLAQRYGPLMLLHFGKEPVLIVSSADTAREIMKTHDIIFANRPESSIFEKLLYGCKDIASAPYGEYWRQIKSICVLHLLSNKRVRSFANVRAEETSLMVERIRKNSSSSLPINFSEVFMTLTNDVVCRVALGRNYIRGEEGGSKLKELFEKFQELLGRFHVSDYIPWLSWVSYFNGYDAEVEKVTKEFDDFLEGVVEEHENRMMKKENDGPSCFQKEDQMDFVDVLLQIQKEKTIGFSIDKVSIKAIILDMFAAGTDTSSTVLEWAMTELLRHPEVMKKLQNEVRGIGGNDITEEELDKMHYLKAVIKETLRLHPPAPLLLPRQSTKDVKIKGYNIATKTQVIVNAWAIGRDPGLWDKAEEFWPERFLINTCVDFRGQDFEFIPFGAGRRGCPGIQFAVTVLEVALAKILSKFDWALPSGAREEDLDMNESTGIVLHKKHPLIAVATPHSC